MFIFLFRLLKSLYNLMTSSWYSLIYRPSVHLPSQTDPVGPGFRMKSDVTGGHWRSQIVLVYGVRVQVTTKQLKENNTRQIINYE